MLKIAITGATGLIGRNLLFEILKQNIKNLDELEIFVLGRGQCGKDIHQRINEIGERMGTSYLGTPLSTKMMCF